MTTHTFDSVNLLAIVLLIPVLGKSIYSSPSIIGSVGATNVGLTTDGSPGWAVSVVTGGGDVC